MTKRFRVIFIAMCLIVGVTTTSYALSNGMFNGFSIINVVVNGKLIKSDVPAVNFYGRTMVPVKFISEELGASVNWDGETSTVYINSTNGTLPTQISQSKNNISEFNRIKMYSKISNHYTWLNHYGSGIRENANGISIALDKYYLLNSYEFFDLTRNHLDERIGTYNEILSATNNVISEANKINIDVSDMNDILVDITMGISYVNMAYYKALSSTTSGKRSELDSYLKFL